MKATVKKAATKKAATKKVATKKAATIKKAKPEDEQAYKEFKSLVNMSAGSLEKWLVTKESKNTGWDSGDGEAIGHKSGKGIVKILRKKKGELTAKDYELMHRVISYISRHKAQKPDGELSDTKWNYSLKNWGYDYSKEK
jgi:hypothetical protein